MKTKLNLNYILVIGLLAAASVTRLFAGDWQPAKGPLMTRWAKEVNPAKTLPEYPRPQMVREQWQNLNGLWDYAIVDKDSQRPGQFDGKILVPFAVESALSGVMKPVSEKQRLWYRRTFEVPAAWQGQRLLLHFGAVDWEAFVFVNGKEVGSHRGGYDGFTLDVTDALKASGPQELVVSVWDPTDASYQPRGKQIRRPHGIWYTPITGIWQTPWLEPVPQAYIEKLVIVPDIDAKSVRVTAVVKGAAGQKVDLLVADGSKKVVETSGAAGQAITARIPSPKLWSPDQPFLYDLQVRLQGANGKPADQVKGYFGMRKIALGKDDKGTLRLCLNNKPLFQFGPLDQGYWPDGLYTAPTDEALRYDIEMTKAFGFNMARKHVKVEPARWYYWCDKLGLLVWQDMPSGDRYIGNRDPDIQRTPESGKQFETELKAMIDGFYNHPCIVMWVPYNEGWGQWDTARIVDLVRQWDPTRLVNNASGWTDRKVGDVMDIHSYPGPSVPRLEEKRAAVLGEFGGLGLPVKGHTWQDEKNWGYRSYANSEELTDAYIGLIKKLGPMTGEPGLSAAVYTQTTDVEVEVNGLMTYDRAMVKMDQAAITAANKEVYNPPAPRQAGSKTLTPPAAPLVACDPYFSIWSPGDNLTDADTTHWTGRAHRLTGLVRIDGKAYRFLGASPFRAPALKQTKLDVQPTRTIYNFEGPGVAITVTFLTPALPDDIDILSRPVTYVTWEAKATDGKKHSVDVYFDASGELTVNETRQQVVWATENHSALTALKIGSKDQPILGKRGDDLRIDWGYLYLAAPKDSLAVAGIGPRSEIQSAFIRDTLKPGQVPSVEAPQNADAVIAAMVLPLGQVGSKPVSSWLMLAYDDIYSIQYMRKNLRPYWRRNGWEAPDLLIAAAAEREALLKRCIAFDEEIMKDLRKAGGDKFAKICSLAFRQCFAASKFVADDNKQPLSFSKENHSNGCIGTSDVFYPMAPQFLLFGPSLAKSFLVPFMNYAASDRWRFPFAPHDLGTYPHANGQVYGGGERTEENQMPVEESGNLLLLMAAVARMEGNADFAGQYWPVLERWADYLKAKGFDPENQLCTDDFAGHLAHNVNLSAKAICGLGAFGMLCEMRGDKVKAQEYAKIAKEFAARWVKEADDGDHFRLAFDRPGTWSQKYNLVWDRILGLNLFPDSVLRKEMEFYKKVQNKYGLPLDNRQSYTKLDWILWTGTLTREKKDLEALVNPVFDFLNATPDRSPMTDWYQTKTARKVGFTARPVVGGVFLEMLYHKGVWNKYAKRDATKAANFAPMPQAPKVTVVVPTSEEQPQTWLYTTKRPGPDFFKPEFNAEGWQKAPGGFGSRGTPSATVRTEWTSQDIWLRREFTLPNVNAKQLQLTVHHDEDVEIYINGVLAASAQGFTTSYEPLMISPAALATLKPGKNLIAIHCRQTSGGQYIDAGLAIVEQK